MARLVVENRSEARLAQAAVDAERSAKLVAMAEQVGLCGGERGDGESNGAQPELCTDLSMHASAYQCGRTTVQVPRWGSG
jgi:hypothetical protein